MQAAKNDTGDADASERGRTTLYFPHIEELEEVQRENLRAAVGDGVVTPDAPSLTKIMNCAGADDARDRTAGPDLVDIDFG